MKVVQINAVYGYGSTGKLCQDISEYLTTQNIENYVFHTLIKSNVDNAICYMSKAEITLNAIVAKVLGNYGFNSRYGTYKLIKKLKKIKPDVIHIHNAHGHNLNYAKLLKYIQQNKIRLCWSFHDCWAFTAYCTHFDYIKCNRWKTRCYNCPQYKEYSMLFDRSKSLYKRKKDTVSLTDDMTIITASDWMGNLIKQSFFGRYNILKIVNGIDIDTFTPSDSDFRKHYGLENKKIVLGIAMSLDEKKGVRYFNDLAKVLPESYTIVLVGVPSKLKNRFVPNILTVPRTSNRNELAQIYSSADVFVNCTLEETFGLVNIEALACGTPVVTFKTGGSSECISDGVGMVVKQGDVSALCEAVKSFAENSDRKKCRTVAVAKYSKQKMCAEHLNLYKVLCNNSD